MHWTFTLIIAGLLVSGVIAYYYFKDDSLILSQSTEETNVLPSSFLSSLDWDRDTQRFRFENDLFNMDISLLRLSEGDFRPFPFDHFINETDGGSKYGATDRFPNDLRRYSFTLTASKSIEFNGPLNYMINQSGDSNCFDNPFESCPTNDRKFVFNDICENFQFNYIGDENHTCTHDDFYNDNPLCEVTFNPECVFELNNDTLSIGFNSPLQSDGRVIIDPTISFSSNDVESISMDVISEREYIIIWCDETQDDTTFAVYFTNGTIITVAKDIDTTNGGCTTGSDYQVDIIILNKRITSASAVWIGSSGEPSTAVFDYITPIASIPIKIFVSGRTSAISNNRLNNTAYAIAWIDSTNRDASAIIIDQDGNNITSTLIIDSEVGDPANAISTTSFNGDDQNFSVIWFDNDANNIQFTTLVKNVSGVTLTLDVVLPPIILDSGVTFGNGAVATDRFDSTRLVLGWLKATGLTSNIKFSTYFKNGTVITANTVIETSVGLSQSISLSSLNTTVFMESWHDLTDTDTDFEIWDIDGNLLVDKIVAFPNIVDGAQASISTNAEDGICRNRIVVASTFSGFPGGGQTKTFFPNGTIWESGVCPCDYSGGDWNTPCDCNITDDIDLGGNNWFINGTGIFTINGVVVSNYNVLNIKGQDSSDICRLRLVNGATIK